MDGYACLQESMKYKIVDTKFRSRSGTEGTFQRVILKNVYLGIIGGIFVQFNRQKSRADKNRTELDRWMDVIGGIKLPWF